MLGNRPNGKRNKSRDRIISRAWSVSVALHAIVLIFLSFVTLRDDLPETTLWLQGSQGESAEVQSLEVLQPLEPINDSSVTANPWENVARDVSTAGNSLSATQPGKPSKPVRPISLIFFNPYHDLSVQRPTSVELISRPTQRVNR